ncbi:hypothetical protein CQA38_00150 [Campylobacter sp. MIT 12-5580]|uniref:hypothetical protein n=1 Tax=Campylobacter sp. MIT 12-5580 TaxID=2040651 RepID=UPI0010F97FAC|nr:hypothetical protein [Campylobacter sp. MIT 12-5580]TKX30089.1 hypothetical protein CQA38_00150 [Campylobacter sp. MIT 12-5580]
MLIFGHKLIQSFHFKQILSENELKSVDKKDEKNIFCFKYDENFIKLCLEKDFKFAILAQNENEILLANALKASFILLKDENLAQKASKMAEFYLFDSKVLLLVPHLKELEKAYKLGVDGVLLESFLR